MELELDVDKEILGWSATPPRRRLVDFIPALITTPLRLWFGFPKATPFEKWIIALHFVKLAFDILVERENALRVAPFASEAPPSYDPTIDPKDLN